MGNFINKTQGNFTIVQNEILNSEKLTFESKGLYVYLLSKPNDWEFSAKKISNQTKESEGTIKRILKNLENENLLLRHKIKNDKGVFNGIIYEILSPVVQKTADGLSADGLSASGFTDVGVSASGELANISNTILSNTNKDISEDISNNISESDFEKGNEDIKSKVFRIWKIYNGKKMSFKIDLEKFLEKTEGVEIDFEKLYKHAIPHNKVYFQTWLNKFFPKSQKINETEVFRQHFLSIGVDEKILDDYINHRKKKKASFSETALKSLVSEINKTDLHANEIFIECINRGWQGFKSEWVSNNKNQNQNGQQQERFVGRQSIDTIQHNANVGYEAAERVRKQMLGDAN
ncbi:hypothetical protein [Myroides odoratus]|uniref:hypothetical protein n=1 Tax=Myroides odoratus TaxID=256 RepID=UPI000765BD42|nr:hypothetical protein [Myroides odoratus]